MAGYPALRTQAKYGPRDIPQFGLKGLSQIMSQNQIIAKSNLWPKFDQNSTKPTLQNYSLMRKKTRTNEYRRRMQLLQFAFRLQHTAN